MKQELNDAMRAEVEHHRSVCNAGCACATCDDGQEIQCSAGVFARYLAELDAPTGPTQMVKVAIAIDGNGWTAACVESDGCPAEVSCDAKEVAAERLGTIGAESDLHAVHYIQAPIPIPQEPEPQTIEAEVVPAQEEAP